METIKIEDIDLNSSFFHFTRKVNVNPIEKEGLKAKIGAASSIKQEKDARVYISKGAMGLLGIKNSFIKKFKRLRICDIPEEYRYYFDDLDYSSEEQVNVCDVYDALEKRFKDEIYFKVDAKEGEDYIVEDFYPEELTSSFRASNCEIDVRGIKNHDIEPSKISLITSSSGNTAFDILEYLYFKLLEKYKTKGKEEVFRHNNSDLISFLEYVQLKKMNRKN